MNVILLGTSHKTAPLEVRERYSLTGKQIPETYRLLSGQGSSEAVILSTCNRTEVYVTTQKRQELASGSYREEIGAVLGEGLEIREEERRYFYLREGEDVVRHLFRVSAGLDSQVVGENEILGQVRDAYLGARRAGTGGEHLAKVFRKGMQVGKIVRGETRISEGNISIGSVGVKMLEAMGGRLKGKKVLIIGAGKIGELVARHLGDRGIAGTFVANRTYEKAKELAERIRGKAVRFDLLKDTLRGADVVISATASPHLILRKEMVQEIMERRQRPLYIMDLALPRDADPGIGDIDNVVLYDLDDLNQIVAENYRNRLKEAEKAEKIIEEEVGKFWPWLERLLLADKEGRSRSVPAPVA